MSEDAPAKSKGRRSQPSVLATDDNDKDQSKAGEILKVLEAATDRSTTAGSGDESLLEGSHSTEAEAVGAQENVTSPNGRNAGPGSPLSLTLGSGGSVDFSFGTTKPAALPPPHCLPKKEEAIAEEEAIPYRSASPVPEGSDEDELGGAAAVVVVTAHTRTPRLGKVTPRQGPGSGARERCESDQFDEDAPEFTFGTTTPIQLPDFTKQPVPQPLSPQLAPPSRAAPGSGGQQQLRHTASSPPFRDEELALAVSPDVQTPLHPTSVQHFQMHRGPAHSPQTPMTPQQHHLQQQMSPFDAAAAAAAQNFAAAHQQMHHHQQQMQMQQEMHMQQQQMHQMHQMQQHARLPGINEDPTWRMMEASPHMPTAIPPQLPGYGPSPSQDASYYMGSPYASVLQPMQSPQVTQELENQEDDDDLEAYLDNVRRNSKQEKAGGKKSVKLAITCDSQVFRRIAASGCIGLLFLLLMVLAIVFFKDRG